MSGLIVPVFVVALVVVLGLTGLTAVRRTQRRAALPQGLGSGHGRSGYDHDSRRRHDTELAARLARQDLLDIQPLAAEALERYRSEWREIEDRLDGSPSESVAAAHALLRSAMSDRGFPTTDADERMSMLSADHTDVTDHYRFGAASEDRWRDSGTADTEDLLQAMTHFRAVFARVVGLAGTVPMAEPAGVPLAEES